MTGENRYEVYVRMMVKQTKGHGNEGFTTDEVKQMIDDLKKYGVPDDDIAVKEIE